jgi:hypothetical protein
MAAACICVHYDGSDYISTVIVEGDSVCAGGLQAPSELLPSASEHMCVGSWNIQHFSLSKSDASLYAIAAVMSAFDVIALQEVCVCISVP